MPYSHEEKTRVFLQCRRSVRCSNLTLNFNLISLVLGWLRWKATIKMQFFNCCCTSLTMPSGVKSHRFLFEILGNLNNSDSSLLVPGTVTCSRHIKGIMKRRQRIICMCMGYCVIFAWYIYSFSFWHLLSFPDTSWWYKVPCRRICIWWAYFLVFQKIKAI